MTDGSDVDGGVGAAAVLYAPRSSTPKILRLHLGPSTRHTVYEAEVVATILGLELLRAESACRSDASVALDNMAAIQASTSRAPGPGRYLTDVFHRNLRALHQEKPISREHTCGARETQETSRAYLRCSGDSRDLERLLHSHRDIPRRPEPRSHSKPEEFEVLRCYECEYAIACRLMVRFRSQYFVIAAVLFGEKVEVDDRLP